MKTMMTALAMLLAAGGAAQAAELYTSPFWGGNDSSETVRCSIINVTTTDKIVNARLIGSSGSVIIETGDIAISAGQTQAVAAPTGLSENVRCHFHVKGSKRGYRAQGTFRDTTAPLNGNDVFTIPAS